MFVSQPLLDVLIGRGIEDVDSFICAPSWSDLPDPFSIPGLEEAVDRVLVAVREKQRITVDGDYDRDGILSSHILQSVLRRLGAESRVYLPHRDEGYGLGRTAVHHFSRSGTDLLLTVDNGINARAAVHLAARLGIEVIVIDHHRIQDRADTLESRERASDPVLTGSSGPGRRFLKGFRRGRVLSACTEFMTLPRWWMCVTAFCAAIPRGSRH
jgi:single-stranded DNA-specific DHH superfamily exonuclease